MWTPSFFYFLSGKSTPHPPVPPTPLPIPPYRLNTNDTMHSVGLAEMVLMAQAPSVANAAGVNPTLWASTASPRVISGDKAEYLFGLHRGRLPMVEIYHSADNLENTAHDRGWNDSTWGLRVHVGGVDQQIAESQARLITYAILASIRNNLRQKHGHEQIGKLMPGVVGHKLECTFNIVNPMSRGTMGVAPGHLLLASGGRLRLMGGGFLMLNGEQLTKVIEVPKNRVTNRGYQRTTENGAARILP